MVGQNLLTSRQPSAAAQRITASPQKVVHPVQHQPGGGAGADDWQQTISVLEQSGPAPPSHAPAGGIKPLTKQPSRDLFPWLSETEQPAFPHITQKQSPAKVGLAF